MFKKLIILITVIIVVAGISLVVFLESSNRVELESLVSEKLAAQNTFGNYEERELIINNQKLLVAIADTSVKHEHGLSGVKKIEEDQGMLFVFDEHGRYNFWMKDMNFAIDILWLDDNNKILEITKNLFPESYPTVYQPSIPVIKVLEVPAGFVEKNKVKVGDRFEE